MRKTLFALAASAAIATLAPPEARAQIPSNLLQQLLPGSQGQGQTSNQNAEQAVREAYERGYRQGRQDQERSDLDRGNRAGSANSGYQQPGQSYPRGQYGR